MKNMRRKKSILRTIFTIWFGTIVVLSIAFISLQIYQRWTMYSLNRMQFERFNDEYKLNILRNTVSDIIGYIDFSRKNIIATSEEEPEIETTQRQILEILKGINFGAQSKIDIAILNSEGKILHHPGQKLIVNTSVKDYPSSDTLIAEYKYFLKQCMKLGGKAVYKPEGEYAGNISYGEFYKPLDLIVCADYQGEGMSIQIRSINLRSLKIDLAMDIAMILIISFFLIFVAILFSYRFSKEMKKETDLLLSYFKDYADRKEPILDESKITYDELGFIENSAKTMIGRIEDLIQTVKDLAIQAEIGNQSKKNFLTSLNHELRTPMTGISGMSDLLLETNLDLKQQDYVKTISESGHRLMTFVEQINEFNEMEEHGLEVKLQPLEIQKVIRSLVEIFKLQADQKEIEFEFNTSNIPEWVETDPERIGQIISPLLGNAIKFTEKGKVSFSVDSCKNENGQISLVFSIRDTGPGISKEKLERIFDFTKEKVSVTKKFGAANLVLTVCKYLVTRMNGKISAESEKNKGTVFTVEIPVTIPEQAKIDEIRKKQQIQTAPKSEDKSLFTGIRTMLVEDDMINRRMALIFLKKLGLETTYAINGKDALEKFKEADFDIIFMDCEMPVMDGYEASQEIRKLDKGKNIPIIAVTANALEGDKKTCLESGMNDHISKPFNIDILRKTLAKYCRK